MKSGLRFSKISRSTRRLVERAIRAGWRPGLRVSDVLRKKRRHSAARGPLE